MHGEGEISAKIIWTGKIKAVPLHRNSKRIAPKCLNIEYTDFLGSSVLVSSISGWNRHSAKRADLLFKCKTPSRVLR